MTLIPASFGGGVWSNGDGMVVEGPGLVSHTVKLFAEIWLVATCKFPSQPLGRPAYVTSRDLGGRGRSTCATAEGNVRWVEIPPLCSFFLLHHST